MVPAQENCSTNSRSSIALLRVSDDAPLALHYEHASPCTSCRPAALYFGWGTDFDDLLLTKIPNDAPLTMFGLAWLR